ncbi:MAG TPA: hypothetical protein VFM18_01575 [Methanosarcina sp.]|nr:hypothetical protein [Methanosarcina sp.]
MNPFIVVEVPTQLSTWTVLSADGVREHHYQTAEDGWNNEIGDIYHNPSGVVWALARNEAEAKSLACRAAQQKPGSRWMWYQIRGIVQAQPGPLDVTEVTDKGALPT